MLIFIQQLIQRISALSNYHNRWKNSLRFTSATFMADTADIGVTRFRKSSWWKEWLWEWPSTRSCAFSVCAWTMSSAVHGEIIGEHIGEISLWAWLHDAASTHTSQFLGLFWFCCCCFVPVGDLVFPLVKIHSIRRENMNWNIFYFQFFRTSDHCLWTNVDSQCKCVYFGSILHL